MQYLKIVLYILVALEMFISSVFCADEPYSGPDDPRAIAEAQMAIHRSKADNGAIFIKSHNPLALFSNIIDIVGLTSNETITDKKVKSTTRSVFLRETSVGLAVTEDLNIKEESTAIKKTLADLGAQRVGERIKISILGDVLFDFDKYDIKADAEKTLYKIVDLIKELKTKQVVIEGHTDSKGSHRYNTNLSIKRAQAVESWLINNGKLTKLKIVAKGYGESKPVAPNTMPDGSDNPKGRAKNRRVEIYISTYQ